MTTSAAFDEAYIHGVAPDEQRRLAAMNQLINPMFLAEMALTSGQRVIDVGSGLGVLTRQIADGVGASGFVLGVERDPTQLAVASADAAGAACQGHIEFRQGDAANLPLRDGEAGSFDIAHCRFVLEHVRAPERIVAEMVRAVKPGGRVLLADDDHDVMRLWPEPPGFSDVWRAYMQTYTAIGCDPIIGRRLPALLHHAGCRSMRINTLRFGACAQEPSFPLFGENLAGVIRSARDRMDALGLAKREKTEHALRALAQWAQRPDAALWYVICFAEGVKP